MYDSHGVIIAGMKTYSKQQTPSVKYVQQRAVFSKIPLLQIFLFRFLLLVIVLRLQEKRLCSFAKIIKIEKQSLFKAILQKPEEKSYLVFVEGTKGMQTSGLAYKRTVHNPCSTLFLIF